MSIPVDAATKHYAQLAPQAKKRDGAIHLKNMLGIVALLEEQMRVERATAAQHISKLNSRLAMCGVTVEGNTVFRDAILQNSMLEKELLHAYGAQ